MNLKLIYTKINAFSLILFLLVSVFIAPVNFGYAAESDDKQEKSNTVLNNMMNNEVVTQSKINDVCGLSTNVKDSLIMSIVTICLPGILEKVKEWKEISCEATVCQYNAITLGVDPSFCEKQKEYKICKFIWGEIFSVPPLTIIETIKDMVKEIIANPVGILFGAGTSKAREYLLGCGSGCPSYTVIPTAGFLFVVDITGVIQTFKDLFENGFDGTKSEQNFCAQARNIKVELEEIVEGYKSVQSIEVN